MTDFGEIRKCSCDWLVSCFDYGTHKFSAFVARQPAGSCDIHVANTFLQNNKVHNSKYST